MTSSVCFSQPNKNIESTAITVSCNAGSGIGTANITIWWFESSIARIQDGFNNAVFLGQVSENNFTWDRGSNIATLDRYSGILTIKPTEGIPIKIQCKKVEKQF